MSIQSRSEQILQDTIDGVLTNVKDKSRIEHLLIQLNELIVSGGGSSSDYAVDLSMTINSSTFVITAQLINKDGDPIGTPQTIDLPMESVVVGASYDNVNKALVLTLQNGTTTSVPVGDLVAGLVSTSDLETALSTKQDVLTPAQLAAVNSGITSTDVAQIETNKNNILSKANTSDVNTAVTNLQGQIQTNKGNIDDLELQIALLNGPVVVTPTWSNKQVNYGGTQGIYDLKRASTDDLIFVPEDCVANINISSYSIGVYYFNENKEYTGVSFSALTVDGSEHRYFRFLFGGPNDIDISQANTICKITISKNATPANTAESIFSEVVGNASAKVVLLGDSITQGIGSTGYVIFNKVIDGTTYSIRGNGPDYPDAGPDYQVGDYIYGDNYRKWYEALDGAGWAQLLKSYLEGKYGCTVKNYGCAGANAADLYAAIQASVIGNGYDIAVVMIGTNNRQDTSLSTYYNDLTRIIKSLESDGTKVIVLGGIPTSVTNEEQFSHHMEDINHLALKCAVSCNVPFISMYSEISDYSEYTGHTIDDFLVDGLHPNDAGYSVFFRLICKKIGIVPKRPGATW